jgi:hypothetical protein
LFDRMVKESGDYVKIKKQLVGFENTTNKK